MNSEVYRPVAPRNVRVGDLLMVRGQLERVNSVAVYAPLDREAAERPSTCPIRFDWWAVAIHTASGATEWLAQPDLPGPR